MISLPAWTHDSREFGKLNGALIIILLPKNADAAEPAHLSPITMIHSLAKLLSKVLALRLAPRIPELISANQTAFIRGRMIHDNFKYVPTSGSPDSEEENTQNPTQVGHRKSIRHS